MTKIMAKFNAGRSLRNGPRKPGVGFFPAAAAIAFLVAASSAGAQPSLKSFSYDWVRLGQTNYLTIEGDNLLPVSRILLADSDGVTAELAPPEKTRIPLATEEKDLFQDTPSTDAKHLRVRVVVAPDASFNPRELRVVTPEGVSNPLPLYLSDLRQTLSPNDNESLAKALAIEMPTVVSGVIRGGEGQYFRFKAEKGSHLIFDVDASRSGSPLDSSMAVLDESGKEIARNEDYNGLDSFLEFVAPQSGSYLVFLRDFRLRGGGDFKFRLTAGALPYLDSIFPFGGRRGMPVELALRGRNLGGKTSLHLNLNPQARLGSQEIREKAGAWYSNPQNFDVSDRAEFNEPDANHTAANANMVPTPVNINGKLAHAKDKDMFRFKVEKGQRLIFEVLASRFGSSLDALLTLSATNGSVIARNDDAVGADSRLDHTFGEAGEYLIGIRDLLHRGGEDFGYRLVIRPPPSANLTAKILGDDVRLNRAGRTGVRVEVGRQEFGGPVEVMAEDLPPGVTCAPLVVESEMSGGWLEFEAAPDAAMESFPLKVVATSLIGDRPVRRVAKFTPGDRAVKQGFITILPMTPFTVDWRSLSAQLEQEQSTTLYFAVKRRDAAVKEVKCTLEGSSTGRDGAGRNVDAGEVTLGPDRSDGSFSVRAKLESEVGRRPVWVRAEASVNGRQYVQYSPPIPLVITEFPFRLSTSLPRLTVTAVPAGSKSEAGQAEFSAKVERRGLFTDDIALTIEGVPEGITLAPTNLPRNINEALIRLSANDKAKPGTTNTLTVIGTASVNGRNLTQRASSVQLIVNAPTSAPDAPMTVATTPPPAGK